HRLERLLRTVVADPDQHLNGIDILTTTERQRILAIGTGAPILASPAGGSLQQRFTEQAARTPDRIAVEADDVRLTYSQLDERVRALAGRLIELGVGAETRVGILLDRSADVIVAVLGILAAGGAYVPLHTRDPEDRWRHALTESGAALVVTRTDLPHRHDLPVCTLDGPWPVPDTTACLPVPSHPDQVAYVMFTSGSSGVPKGVAVTHRDVTQLIDDRSWKAEHHRSVLLHAPHAFDILNYELWVPLLAGGRITVAPPGDVDATALDRLIRERSLTSLHLTAGLFRVVAQEQPAVLAGLREVLTGGDVVPPHAVARVVENCPTTTVRQLYGPTEATLCATQYVVPRELPAAVPARVPIGRPLDGTRVYVLDRSLQPAPLGAVGEIYLAGAGVARGYVNRPAATAQRFVGDPFGPPGSRMYRTGDLGRWSEDGNLDFAGRTDDQVKIRGFRVEPAEVETVLAGLPQLTDVAVFPRQSPSGDTALVGYVVSTDDTDARTLRAEAATVLPDYMVPATFVVLDSLPVTANGKVDRRALPEPAWGKAGQVEARTFLERLFCDMFAEVLGLPRVGVDDSFFELGGHSLLGVRLVSRIRARLGAELTVRSLFEEATPAGLAARFEQPHRPTGSGRTAFDALLPLRTSGDRIPLFCVHPAVGMSWCYAGLVQHLPDRPVYALQAPGLADDGRDAVAGYPHLRALAEEYVARVRAVRPSGPYHLLGWSFGGVIAHAMAALLQEQDEPVGMLAMLDSYPDPEVSTEEPDESALFVALLEAVGVARPAELRSLDLRRTRDLLRESGGALADVSEDQLSAIVETTRRHLRLGSSHQPGKFRGDLLFFEATQHVTARRPPVDLWTPHVTGDIHVRPVASRHGEMTLPEPLAGIAAVVREHLRRLELPMHTRQQEER
ncbi:amino acid adenylation domain-containing protein, partial [Micromonospora sp. NPDC049051]|uniref:amino acid adenylation domain-containing protein n=1 Tax=Micromonospora sp. NPDC049051 TaxID=3364264 RepID=UPI00372013F6